MLEIETDYSQLEYKIRDSIEISQRVLYLQDAYRVTKHSKKKARLMKKLKEMEKLDNDSNDVLESIRTNFK